MFLFKLLSTFDCATLITRAKKLLYTLKGMDARCSNLETTPQKNIPASLATDLNFLENSFNNTKTFSDDIFKLFELQNNVFKYALDLMYFSKDFPRGRACSLSQAIIESLKQFCKQNNVYHKLTLELKSLALSRVCEQPNGCFVELICNVFKVKEDYQYFKTVIENSLNDHKFKEAFYLITALDAEKDFTLEEFAFPVFFLDKEPWVKHFLKKRPELQRHFVQTLDAICLSGNDIQNFVWSLPYSNLPIRRHVYDPSRLQKLLTNYLDSFDIDIKLCKNLYQARSENAMNYLCRKRYKEESIGQEAFEEMVKCVIADNIELQKALLVKLVCYNNSTAAFKLAEDLNLPRKDWPETLLNTPICKQESETSFISMSNGDDYLKLRLDKSDIHFVDTPEKCMEAISDISENYNVVGIDAEWRPNLGIMKENLSVYQLAVWDTVYIFDILALKKSSNTTIWIQFVEKIFGNQNILKLGYGCKYDIHLIMSLCHEKKAETQKSPCNVLDFCEFFKKVKTSYPDVHEKMEDTSALKSLGYSLNKGLSQLCCSILGKPLNKDEQFSDWEHRPLRESQLLYAALDAFCLLLMYEKLFHVVQELNLDLENVIKNTSSAPNPASPKKEKPAVRKKTSQKLTHTLIPVSQFKVVVDNMVHGVGKYLRICGADVVFIDNEDDHMKTVEVSQLENRVVLTAGAPYEKIKGYVPENMIFCVPTDENARDQASIILKQFNVQCTEADIFSRCSVCNGNIYKKVSSEELFRLWSSSVDSSTNWQKEAVRLQRTIPVKERFISEDGTLDSGVPVQLSVLSPKVFETVRQFFICTKCGKIYWEGSHFSRVKKHISEFIQLDDSSRPNVYQGSAETAEQILRNLENDDEPKLVSTHSENAVTPKKFMSFDIESDSDDEINNIVFSCS